MQHAACVGYRKAGQALHALWVFVRLVCAAVMTVMLFVGLSATAGINRDSQQNWGKVSGKGIDHDIDK
jgi:hypothetical protein